MTNDISTQPGGLLKLLNVGCIAAMGWMLMQLAPEQQAMRNGLAPPEAPPCVMDQPGYLRGHLYGAIESELNWQGETMLCDGMPRPEGAGIRLVFSEQADPSEPGLVIVIGIADAQLGADPQELSANVTIIDQRNSQFFSTQEEPRCWTVLTKQLRLTGTVEEVWRIDGELYCASALAALAGPGSVTLDNFSYSGSMRPNGTGTAQ